ncbi:DNA processing protein DprA [Synergistales bacterium]|nr:DNA processing protein DprA [Synergistales bacterium]
MDDSLKAKLILNACLAPMSAWKAVSDEPGEFVRGAWIYGGAAEEEYARRLSLRPSSLAALTKLIAERDWPEREMERVARFDARFVTIDDDEYPSRLKDLQKPPIGLYIKGSLNEAKPSVAIVGTRRCSQYGKTVADALGRAMAKVGFQVVSGGAIGIDTVGHRACLAGGGATTAVFGTAIDRVYPAENRELFREIATQGALVSEYPMGTGGESWHFPLRNRIIVGLAGTVVVVESPEDGGSMITARLALDAGREVWAVPGRLSDTSSRGTNALLRDGANVLCDIEDFAEKISGYYGQLFLDLPNSGEPMDAPVLSSDEKAILEILRKREGRTLDDIMAEGGLGFVEAQTGLATLSAYGLVVSSGPGRYSAGV